MKKSVLVWRLLEASSTSSPPASRNTDPILTICTDVYISIYTLWLISLKHIAISWIIHDYVTSGIIFREVKRATLLFSVYGVVCMCAYFHSAVANAVLYYNSLLMSTVECLWIRYNFRSLGIRVIRNVSLSRGSREGNNAFTKVLKYCLLKLFFFLWF